jgi:DNA-binding beta-propeller fold protein YncE
MLAQLVHDNLTSGRGFIFSGLLLGALPYWNAPVFTAAAAVLAFLFVLFPYRRYMVGLALTAGLVGLPQVLALRAGNARMGTSLIHWGYTLGNVPVSQVVKYLGFTFGLKWVLILLGLIFFSWRNLRLFIAICSLFLLTFCFQFSEEALANHKFLNIWLVLANLFAAYGLWRLWHLRIKGWAIPSRLVAIVLTIPIVIGGIIDFFPIHNIGFVYTNYTNDRLIGWIRAETKPNAVFLTDKFVNHPILLAGRRIFYGYTYFTWGAGYDLPKREAAYTKMYESKNAHQVFTLLKANKIDYVAFDGGIRSFFKNSNEQQVYAPNFKKVFEGTEYWQLTIYKIPENADFVPISPGFVPGSSPAPGISAFEGGKGKEDGQFDFPRGVAVDNAGNILVADTGNGRIQKFSPAGIFVSVIGAAGQGPGQFKEPCGMGVDSSGNIYVADVGNGRVQKLKPDGSFLAEWKGPEPGFYGPRDLAVGPDNSVYVVDQGHSRIVKFDSNGRVLATWGSPGPNDGQLFDPTSVAVDGKRVYVADARNKRIAVFDVDGKFIANWLVEEWSAPSGWYLQDLVVDSKAGLLYVSSGGEVLVFDLTGKKIAALAPAPPDKLEGSSSIALLKNNLYVVNAFSCRLSRIEVKGK